MYKKILVPIDGSEPSKHALKSAMEFALKWDAELLVISVIPPVPAHIYSEISNFTLYTRMIGLEEYDNAIELAHVKVLLEAENTLKESHPELKITTILTKGYVSTRIMEIAEEEDVDLIVMGCRGLSGIKSWFLGGVSRTVVEHCKKPILIVK